MSVKLETISKYYKAMQVLKEAGSSKLVISKFVKDNGVHAYFFEALNRLGYIELNKKNYGESSVKRKVVPLEPKMARLTIEMIATISAEAKVANREKKEGVREIKFNGEVKRVKVNEYKQKPSTIDEPYKVVASSETQTKQQSPNFDDVLKAEKEATKNYAQAQLSIMLCDLNRMIGELENQEDTVQTRVVSYKLFGFIPIFSKKITENA